MSRAFDIQVDAEASLPLATQISQQIGWLIVGGVIAEGEQLPTVGDLADDLGVNVHTVRAGYQQLAAQGMLSLAQGRRATVRAFDRARTSSSHSGMPTYSIGVILPAFVPFYASLLDGIEEAASKHPALVFATNAREDPITALKVLDQLVARNVDGIVVASPLIPPEAELPPAGRPPIVHVDAPGAPGPVIDFDLEEAQYLATSHLVRHGHTAIGFIGPRFTLANVAPKLAGHLRALAEAGVDASEGSLVEADDFEISSGYRAAQRLLDSEARATALAAGSDTLAAGAYHAIRERGLRIPDDIAVVGNDGLELAAHLEPGLTTVELPVQEAGRRAVEAIQDIRAGGSTSGSLVLDVDLVVRDSCGPHGS